MHNLEQLRQVIAKFFRRHWIGVVLILLATLIFFWPVVIRMGSYSEGGDAMFNAWTLARDHHCILRQGCPSYVNGNIFYPHKESMLYSETQLSAGLITLPLYFINDNPIFSYNVWMIVSFFLMGLFMYLLAKHLSKGNEIVSVMAGLIYEFAPFRMPAISHMQNISIFYLPLAILLILKFMESKKRSYLVGLFITLVLQFYASWYQMIFVLIVLGILMLGLIIFKLEKLKPTIMMSAVILLAALSTYPLAKSYVNFSKSTGASFSVQDQATYASSLIDYVTPEQGTLLGKLFYHIEPSVHRNSYDTDSYSYYGVTLTVLSFGLLVLAYKERKKSKQLAIYYKLLVILFAIAIVGFVMSLGPLLKIRNSYLYNDAAANLNYAIVLPYMLVDKLLPQLDFIRAIGRAGVLILFSLCCSLAIMPFYAKRLTFYNAHRIVLSCLVMFLLIFELLPFHQVPMSPNSYSYNLTVPAVYKFIKSDNQVNNIIILSADFDYPKAGIPTELPEEDLWAGYTNKNIFNGYSGYLPPTYYADYYNFLRFRPAVIPDLKKDNLRYVLVDKLLSSSNPHLVDTVSNVLGSHHIVYNDNRYTLFRV